MGKSRREEFADGEPLETVDFADEGYDEDVDEELGDDVGTI